MVGLPRGASNHRLGARKHRQRSTGGRSDLAVATADGAASAEVSDTQDPLASESEMRFDPELIRTGTAFDVRLPDYASNALKRLVDAVEVTDDREVTELEAQHLREAAEEAMAGLVAAETTVGNDSSSLVTIAGVVAWVRDIQAVLEANAN